MQKSILYFILLFFCTTTLVAQKDFHKLYDYQNENDFGTAISQSNNDYIVFGNSNSNLTRTKFLKVDSIGNNLFHKEYLITNDEINGGGIWKNGYYAFGSHYDSTEGARDSHFFFINGNGDSSKVIAIDFAFNDRISDAILLADSTFIVLGLSTDTNANDTKPFIARVDSLGTILWQESHDDSTLAQYVKNVAATADGGYIIGGEEYETPQGWLDLFLLKVDSVGKLEWKKTYGLKNLSQFVGHVSVHPDGGYILVGSEAGSGFPKTSDRSIIKTDSAGNLLWQKTYGTTSYQESFRVARILPDGGFICAGSSFHTYNNKDVPDINLTRLDSAGNLLWSKDFTYHGQHSHDYVKDLQITSDSGYVMTGFIINNLLPARNDLFILKTNDQGIITNVNSGFREVPTAWKIYPNPTQGQFTIPQSQNIALIQIYNLQGQKVQEVMPNRLSETQVQLQGAPGVYIIQLQMEDGSVESAKVLKQ